MLPSIFVSLFAGILVDRVNRKYLMILSDGVAAISTLIAGPLSDRILEPAMQSETSLNSLFAPIFERCGCGCGNGVAVCGMCDRHVYCWCNWI